MMEAVKSYKKSETVKPYLRIWEKWGTDSLTQ